MSAWPLATIASAWAGVVIMPTVIVQTPVARRIASANGTWKPGPTTIFCCGEMPPDDTSTHSTPRDRLLESPAVIHPVGRRQPDADRLVRRERGAHRLEYLEREPHAVGER